MAGGRGEDGRAADSGLLRRRGRPSLYRTVVGPAVADLIHLLAELLDNATAFSPPETQILVRGNLVGRGLVIEIEDQGLGIPTDQREQLNTMLADPPDFGVHTLSEDTRLGLFVVAQLAHRHGIRITLVESAYGGVRAVVLVPAALLAVEGEPVASATGGHHAVRPTGRPADVPDSSSVPETPPSGERAAAPAPGASARPARPPALVEVAVDPGRPLLPQRRRMDHLVPQLSSQPEPPPAPADVEPGDTGPIGLSADADGGARRSRHALGALQRGTRDARQSAPADDGAEGAR